jgi:hypothetical protein
VRLGKVKRKYLILLLLISSAVFTIVVRAERRSGDVEPQLADQRQHASVPVLSRFTSLSFLSGYLSVPQEESGLIFEGGVFLLLGFFWLKRTRRVSRTAPGRA